MVRQCLCLVFPLPSWLRHCLCLVCSTAFVAKTLPLPCVSTAFVAKTLPLPCGPLQVPKEDDPVWEDAKQYWRTLATDDGAHFDTEVMIDAADIAPTVTWGTSPQDTVRQCLCLCFHCVGGEDTAFALCFHCLRG